MSPILNYVLVYVVGWASGSVYRRYMAEKAERTLWSHIHTAGWNWPTIALTVALVCGGTLWWQDHTRWNDYLDCQDGNTTNTALRTAATAKRDDKQTIVNTAQRDLNAVLHDIGSTTSLDGEPPTPAEQRRAIRAYSLLEPTSARAETAYVGLVIAQNRLDKVRDTYPVTECGTVPG